MPPAPVCEIPFDAWSHRRRPVVGGRCWGGRRCEIMEVPMRSPWQIPLVSCSIGVAVALSLAACSSSNSSSEASSTVAGPVASGSAIPRPDITLFGDLPTEDVDATSAAKLQPVLDKAIQAGNPAVLAAVLTPQGMWAGAAGIDGPGGRKATPDDVWAIASISKTFTAALVLKLAEAGKIDLDKPLSD